MKKQYKDITINGGKYAWAYIDRSSYGRGAKSYVKIWKDKKLLMENTVEFGQVSPKIVSDMIETYNSNIIKTNPIVSFGTTQITR